MGRKQHTTARRLKTFSIATRSRTHASEPAAAAIRFALILGLVLIESLALYTLVIIILQVK